MALTNPNYLVDTTFSAKNISSATSVYAWTVTASVKAQIIVAMTIAGTGDYVAYLAHQWLGAGSNYVILPKTTGTSAAGETIIEFATIPMQFKATDVVNVMVDGLAGDTSISGVIRIVSDNFSTFEAADTVSTVTTTGTAIAVTTVNGLAAGVITAAAIATGAIDADAIADNAIDAGAIATGAITADKIATDAITAAKIAADAITSSEIADGALTSTKFGAGAAAAVSSVLEGAVITIIRGDTLAQAITGLGSNASYISLDFSVKYSRDDSDDDAIIRIRKNASTTGDGLMRFKGAAVATPYAAADGSITVVSTTALTINLIAGDTDDLVAQDGLYYDIQMVKTASVSTLTEGTCNIRADVTRLVA